MSDRHPKWQRVEPGTVIPAGQPYMIEYPVPFGGLVDGLTRSEYIQPHRETIAGHPYFVDSSWKPPLDLPTEPTWGIAVYNGDLRPVGRWVALDDSGALYLERFDGVGEVPFGMPLDFIPLTDEQVARIEAAR